VAPAEGVLRRNEDIARDSRMQVSGAQLSAPIDNLYKRAHIHIVLL